MSESYMSNLITRGATTTNHSPHKSFGKAKKMNTILKAFKEKYAGKKVLAAYEARYNNR